MNKPSLDGPESKIERGRKHLEALYEQINAFIDSKPHEVVDEFDPETRRYEARIKVNAEPPHPEWGLMVGDFVNNLRSGLDHIVWQLVLLAGAKPGRDNQFPIGMSGPAYWCAKKDRPSLRDRALKGVSDEHRTLVDEFQPYRRGNRAPDHPLAVLAWLSNVDKHQVIHPTVVAVLAPSQSDFTMLSDDDTATARIEVNTGPLEDGATILTATITSTDPNAKVNMYPPIPLGIGFGESEALRADGLGDLLKYVQGIYATFRPHFE